MPQNQQFNVVANITGYTVRKSADGDEKYVLTGLASNTDLDLTGERMADTAIEAMAKSLETNTVKLNNEHRDGWDDDFGEVTRLWVNDNHELMMEAELDPDHYRTKTLIKHLNKGAQLGLSIGGIVVEAAMEWFEAASKKVMTYKNIALYHVAITGTPAVAATWVNPITKSVKDWKDTAMDPNKDTTETTEETTGTVEPEAKPEADATTVEPVTETPTDAQQEVVETTDTPAEHHPASPTEPVETSAADEQDREDQPDGADATKSAALQADEKLRQVAKAKLLGSWVESEITDAAIESITWSLRDALWSPMHTGKDDTRSKAERIAEADAVLTEYHDLILAVATALINTGVDETAAADVERNVKGTTPTEVSKSLSDKDTALTEVTKARDEATAKLDELTKAVTGKDEEIAMLTKRADESAAELETTKSSLAEATKKVETLEARKALVFDKFTGPAVEVQDAKALAAEANRRFAEALTGGVSS